jgi:hypothetical protein
MSQATPTRVCMRCDDPITDTFDRSRFCSDCKMTLQRMSFNGEEVVEMIAAIMPAAPDRPNLVVPVDKVIEVATKVMMRTNLILPIEPPKQDNDEPGGGVPQLVG